MIFPKSLFPQVTLGGASLKRSIPTDGDFPPLGKRNDHDDPHAPVAVSPVRPRRELRHGPRRSRDATATRRATGGTQ